MNKNLLVPTPLIPAFIEALPAARAMLAIEVTRHTTTYPTVPPCHVCGGEATWGHLTDEGLVSECEAHRELLTVEPTVEPVVEPGSIDPETVCGPLTYIENMLNDMLALNRAAGAVIEMDEAECDFAVSLAIAAITEIITEALRL